MKRDNSRTKFSDWVYNWASRLLDKAISELDDDLVIDCIQTYTIFASESWKPDLLEQDLYDALTPDEKVEYGAYEETDPDYCFDQLDFSGEVYGNRYD